MPSKYIIRNFTVGGTYHIFHRSISADLFQDEDDYRTFLFYLYTYLRPVKQVLKLYPELPFRLQINNLSKEIDAFAYVLLPNHFHLILRQHQQSSIPRLMKQLSNAYTEYYNKKYNHKGSITKGRYRAATLATQTQILELSRFIHLHPTLSSHGRLLEYPWSSLQEYLDDSIDSFINKRLIRSFFSSRDQYVNYVQNTRDFSDATSILEPVIIERDILRG